MEKCRKLLPEEEQALVEKPTMARTLYKYYIKLKEGLETQTKDIAEAEEKLRLEKRQIDHDQTQVDETVRILKEMYQIDVETIKIVTEL